LKASGRHVATVARSDGGAKYDPICLIGYANRVCRKSYRAPSLPLK
jgi:hypothetical protein